MWVPVWRGALQPMGTGWTFMRVGDSAMQSEPGRGQPCLGKGTCTSDGRLVMYVGISQVNRARVTGAKFLTAGEGSTNTEKGERQRQHWVPCN